MTSSQRCAAIASSTSGRKVSGGLAAPFDRNEIAPRLAREDLSRTRDLLIGIVEHLLPLRQPAGDARDGEEDREHVHRKLHRLIDESRIEIDIRVELALDEVLVFEGDSFELEGDVEQRIFSGHVENVIRRFLDDLRA